MEHPNIIMIVIDTLRKDYSKPLKKVLEPLGFVSYENVIAPSPWTIPSHASLFTGMYPSIHGAHETKMIKAHNIKFRPKPEFYVPAILKNSGYTNYLLTSNIFVTPYFGFSFFDWVYEYSSETPIFSKFNWNDRIKLEKLSRDTTLKTIKNMILNKELKLLSKSALRYISLKLWNTTLTRQVYGAIKNWPKDKGSSNIIKHLKSLKITTPSFIFINLMEVHEPYLVSELNYMNRILVNNLLEGTIDSSYANLWRTKYQEEVEYITKRILEIIQILKDRGILYNSLIIITSDHGQLLGEYGYIGHGAFLFDELLRVPLFIKYPYDIEMNKESKNCSYISLTMLKDIILKSALGELNSDSNLYSPVVFSESYGTHHNINAIKLSNRQKRSLETIEKYRIAIYYKTFKGIFNVTDWKFETIISYDPNIEVTDDIVKHMKKEVTKFLKTATLAKVPKIKL